MAEISIGEAVGEGFALIRGRPLAVLGWGLTQIALTILAYSLLGRFFLTSFQAMAQPGLGGAPSPAAMQQMIQLQPISQLVNLLNLLVSAVLYCAVFRAVLHPEQRRFAYLRVGAPELYMVGLIFGGLIALGIGILIAALAIGLVVGVLVAVHAVILAVLIGVVGGVALVVGLIYAGLRLSLVGPMMVDDGQFHLGDAWRLTRGKVFSLLAVALLTWLILLAAALVLGIVSVAVGFGALSAIAGGVGNLQTFFQQSPALIAGKMIPLALIAFVIWTPVAGCIMAIAGAPYARAYRDLMPAGDVSETFA